MSLNIADKKKKLLEDKSQILKAMAHPIRLCIVKILVEMGESNVSGMQNCLLQPQSTISQHLSKLKAVGLISGKRKGTEIIYTVVNDDAKKLACLLLPDQAV